METEIKMKNFIDNVNFHILEAQKYWSPTSTWTPERKKQEVKDAILQNPFLLDKFNFFRQLYWRSKNGWSLL